MIINSNCDEKYIYFDQDNSFCINSVPGVIYDINETNSFLISKKNKNVNEINENDAKNILDKLFNVVKKEKIAIIYELQSPPNNLDEFITSLENKYEINRELSIRQIMKDIISGKITYEIQND